MDRREHEERLDRGVRADERITNDYVVVGVPVVLITSLSRRTSHIDVRRDGVEADAPRLRRQLTEPRSHPGRVSRTRRNQRTRGGRGQTEVPCAGTLVSPSTRDLRALNSCSLIAPESSSVLALAISSAGELLAATSRT